MATGKVKTIKGNFGFIKPDQGGGDVYFQLRWVQGTNPNEIHEGMELEYEAKPTDRGLQTTSVRALHTTTRTVGQTTKQGSERTEQQPTTLAQNGSYRFLNPYNFVRPSAAPKQNLTDDPQAALMGRVAPPPHDRYVGHSGTIECELEAVTPLFIADAATDFASDKDQEKDHKRLKFFTYDFGNGPEPALPASSLRGMLRSLFEAATNSCYAHFDYERRLSYHLAANEALKLVPGRVEKDEQGHWQLQILSGDTPLSIGKPPRPMLYAARVEQYEALVSGRAHHAKTKTKVVFSPVNIKNFSHGERCVVLAEKRSFPPVWQVRKVAKEEDARELWKERRPGTKEVPQLEVFAGYLSITNQNIESKRFERFFFRPPINKTGPTHVPLTDSVRADYNILVDDYRERHAKTIEKWQKDKRKPYQVDKAKKESAFSRFIYENEEQVKLQDGTLVYAMLSGSTNAPKVEFIVPVAVPRVLYDNKIAALLPAHLWKCGKHDELCPACRTFGWVYGDNDDSIAELQGDLAKQVAYAGRVRLEHGRLVAPAKPMSSTSLAILSSPKPTTTRFYLKPENGTPQDGQGDWVMGYDNPQNMLRGRKFYRHHGHDGDQAYWQAEGREYQKVGENSDQNRTLKDPVAPGSKFRFTINFANLAAVELGALLWALEMEGEQVHRLGMAKPLGFGSVRIRTTSVNTYDFSRRYQSLDADAGKAPLSAEQVDHLRDAFKTAMKNAYGNDFDQLPNIRDILALLSKPEQDLPIHYPRPTQQADKEGKNFEWFVGNNRSGKDAGPRLGLPVATEDRTGLPLIDRFGKIKQR